MGLSFSGDNLHFLTGTELSGGDLLSLLDKAEELRIDRYAGKTRSDLAGKTIALLFEKPSLRTHMSFTIAVQELGAHVLQSYSLNRKSEEPEDVGRVAQGYFDAVMLRTHAHELIERMAANVKIPVINGLSDTHHPCQILADLLTLKQKFGKLQGLEVAYVGDGNNILHSLLLLLPRVGVTVRYACPRGYEPHAWIVQQAKAAAAETKTKVQGFTDPKKAVRNVDAIYTDVWTSMGFEAEQEAREKAFQGFQVNAGLLGLAQKHAVIMHCLPMVRGKEISEDLVDHPNSVIFQQSENRLHAQKALLLALLAGRPRARTF